MMHLVRPHQIALAMLGFAFALSTHAGELEGNVLDQDGKPVANALVAANQRQTQIGAEGNILRHRSHSDARGHFLLQGLPAGLYGATATAPGMGPAFIGNLAIPETGRLDKQVLRLGGPTIAVEGTLQTAAGALPDGAIVGAYRISDDEGDVFYAEASDGRYRISLSPGKYYVTARAPGWGSLTAQKSIAATDETLHLDFKLVRESGSDLKLSREIIEMEAADQKVRFAEIRTNDAVHQQATATIDAKNEARVKEILKEYGWPNADLIGDQGVHALWVLVQHESPPVLKQCLPDMKAAAELGELEWATVALSIDRDLMYDCKKQLYGSQVQTTDGKVELYPVEDEAHLDERRAKIGLGPIAEYKAGIAKLYAQGSAN